MSNFDLTNTGADVQKAINRALLIETLGDGSRFLANDGTYKSGKLTTNDYTTEEKNKLAGISANANKTEGSNINGNIKIDGIETTVYTHPSTHLASIIVENSTHRFVTDAEKDTWNNKVDKIEGKGLSTNDYTTEEKNKLAGISANANKTEGSNINGNIKIDGIETTVYTHPSTHLADMITENPNKRFVSDMEKETWNNKVDKIVDNAVGIKDKIVTGVILLMKDENGYYMRADGLGNHMLCYSENGYFAFPLDATITIGGIE